MSNPDSEFSLELRNYPSLLQYFDGLEFSKDFPSFTYDEVASIISRKHRLVFGVFSKKFELEDKMKKFHGDPCGGTPEGLPSPSSSSSSSSTTTSTPSTISSRRWQLAVDDAFLLFQFYLTTTSSMTRAIRQSSGYLYPQQTVILDITLFLQVVLRLRSSNSPQFQEKVSSLFPVAIDLDKLDKLLTTPSFIVGWGQISPQDVHDRFGWSIPNEAQTLGRSWDIWFSDFKSISISDTRYALFRGLVKLFYSEQPNCPLLIDILTLQEIPK